MFEWLKRLFGIQETTFGDTGRVYYFKLPYKIGGMKVPFAVKMLKKEKLWSKLPKDMRVRLASAGWKGVVITKKDLDRLDDETWGFIAKKLKLKWK